jgi:hypothetical protein
MFYRDQHIFITRNFDIGRRERLPGTWRIYIEDGGRGHHTIDISFQSNAMIA